MQYTKDQLVELIPPIKNTLQPGLLANIFQEKCKAFKETLFLAPSIAPPINLEGYRASSSWEWPKLNIVELANACSAKIKGKTPGPDNITQVII